MSGRAMIRYEVRLNPRTHRINITVRRDGTVWVTKPRWVSAREVERFVKQSSQWILRAKERFADLPKTSRIESSKREYRRYKGAALVEAVRRTRHFNVHYRFRYQKLFVRNQKSRWGSCSRAGNLSFNYRILFLPPHLADYVIVHELCHLKEMNHSKAFWTLVGATIPDWATRRKELRRWGGELLLH